LAFTELLTDKKLGGSTPKKEIKRITYHEVTKEAVEEALKHPRAIDEHLREAQEARRVLDRLVGYDLSGLIWKKVRYGLSPVASSPRLAHNNGARTRDAGI